MFGCTTTYTSHRILPNTVKFIRFKQVFVILQMGLLQHIYDAMLLYTPLLPQLGESLYYPFPVIGWHQPSRRDNVFFSEAFTVNFLQTPLPFTTSLCYHNPGPGVDLCGSWPGLPLPHVCVTLSAERPDFASWRRRRGHTVLSGTGKGSGHEQEQVREWKEHRTIYVPCLPSIIHKQHCHIFSKVYKALLLDCVSIRKLNWPWGQKFLSKLDITDMAGSWLRLSKW